MHYTSNSNMIEHKRTYSTLPGIPIHIIIPGIISFKENTTHHTFRIKISNITRIKNIKYNFLSSILLLTLPFFHHGLSIDYNLYLPVSNFCCLNSLRNQQSPQNQQIRKGDETSHLCMTI